MRPGTYRDRDGVLVVVERTESGYLLTYPDGKTVAVG